MEMGRSVDEKRETMVGYIETLAQLLLDLIPPADKKREKMVRYIETLAKLLGAIWLLGSSGRVRSMPRNMVFRSESPEDGTVPFGKILSIST